MKILATHLKKFMDYAELRGISYRALIQSMKNPPKNFNDPHAKADLSDYYNLIEYIATALGEDLVGVRVGSQLNLNTLGVIYKISLKAATNEEVIFYCHSYLKKTLPSLKIELSTSGRAVMTGLSIKSGSDHVDRIILETLLTIMAREIKIISGEHTNVQLFSPYYHAGYPMGWKKGESFSIKFNRIILKAALRDVSGWGLDVLIPEYLTLIEQMKSDYSFAGKVKIAALNLARPTLPDLKTLAGVFNLDDRTFQRRLNPESTTYRQIIDELKQEISDLLLRHDRFSISDISSALGYSEPSAFIRSFRKWYGKSPLRMKKTAVNGLKQ
jgi:AraC-like DNA-binding protein